LQDAENGVRGTDFVNGYASGLYASASWNKELAYTRASYLGPAFKGKRVNVALGPVAGPIGRVVRGGRNLEGFSNDPYLSRALTGVSVRSLQKSVITCIKHVIANEQETNRMPPILLPSS
jgi:beta-glucosidase